MKTIDCDSCMGWLRGTQPVSVTASVTTERLSAVALIPATAAHCPGLSVNGYVAKGSGRLNPWEQWSPRTHLW